SEALKGTRIPRVTAAIEAIAEYVLPDALALLVNRNGVALLAQRARLDEDRVRRIVDVLAKDRVVLGRIETVEVEDVPSIELLDGTYKASRRLSAGQRCTTILPVLLLEGDRPLLIDQPED